jgi:DNA-binding FrmR family transcriptional regulator
LGIEREVERPLFLFDSSIEFRLNFTIMKYPVKIQNRIKRVEGQVSGVKNMIVKGDSDTRVMTQLQACISSLESLKIELVKQQMKESMLEDIKETLGMK